MKRKFETAVDFVADSGGLVILAALFITGILSFVSIR